jgi:hypothetical protein
MTTPDPAAIAAGLGEPERRLIAEMSDGEMVYPIANTAADASVPLADARKIFRHFREAGLAEYGALWNEDEYRPAGSGTWLTPLGLAVRAHLLKEPSK